MRPPRELAPTNVANPAHVAALERLEELRQRLERDDMIVTLKTPQARRVLWRVLDQSGVFSDVSTADPLALAHRVGQQSIGRFLWAAIDDVDDQAVMLIRAEARARVRRELEQAEAARIPYADQQEE